MIESIGEDLADRALRKGKATLHEVAGRAIMLVIGFGALLMAIGWGVYAGFLAMAQEMTPIQASLVVGGILLVVSAALIGLAVKGKNVVPDPKPVLPSPEVEALYAVRFMRGLISGNGAQRKSNLTMLAVALAMGAMEGKRTR